MRYVLTTEYKPAWGVGGQNEVDPAPYLNEMIIFTFSIRKLKKKYEFVFRQMMKLCKKGKN